MSSFVSSRVGRVAFWLWAVGGGVLVFVNWYVWDRFTFWFPNEHTQETFQLITPTPERWARMWAEECDRWKEQQARQEFRRSLVSTGYCLEWSAFLYAAVGAVLFRRWGWAAFPIAGAIALLSLLAEWDVNFW